MNARSVLPRLAGVAALLTQLGAGTGPSPAATLRIYVPNQMGASISVLDGEGRLIETVDLRALGFSAHAMPHQVAAQPDGSAWYVTLAGDGYVLRFDGSNRLVARTAIREPGMVVLDHGRDRLFVSRALGSINPPRSLAVLRASDLELLDEPDIFIPRPHALAVDTVTGRVYAGSLSTNQIAMLDFSTGDVRLTDVPGPPQAFVGLAVSPDGRSLAATTQLSGRLLVFATGDSLAAIASVPVETLPYDVTFSPDGTAVWFPNQRAGAVTRVDTRTWTVASVIRHDAFQEPHGVVLSPDGATVYVTSHGRITSTAGTGHGEGLHDMDSPRANGTLAVLDAATGMVRSVTEVGVYAAAPGLAAWR